MLVNPILVEFVLGGWLGFQASRGRLLSGFWIYLVGAIGVATLAAQIFAGLWDVGRALARPWHAVLLHSRCIGIYRDAKAREGSPLLARQAGR